MRGLTYPDGIFYNETSIQRGSLLTVDWTGDALTPFEPALPLDGKEKIKRLNPDNVGLHTIPVTPIPYGSAKEIMNFVPTFTLLSTLILAFISSNWLFTKNNPTPLLSLCW